MDPEEAGAERWDWGGSNAREIEMDRTIETKTWRAATGGTAMRWLADEDNRLRCWAQRQRQSLGEYDTNETENNKDRMAWAYVRKRRENERGSKQATNAWGSAHPPSSAGQRDQFKWDRLISNTQTRSRVAICLWQTRSRTCAAMCTHEKTHPLRCEEQTEMKGINRLEAHIWRVQCTPERINRNWSRQTAKGQQQ